MGEVYGLPRHLFDEEAIERVGRAARRAREVDRGCGARHGERLSRRWACALPARDADGARGHAPRRSRSCSREYMPFDLVIDEQTAWGDEARVSKTSVCGSWGADRRRAALLRRQVRQSARVDRGDAGADGPHSPVRDGRRSGARRTTASGARRRSCCGGAWSTSASSWSARSRRWTSFPPEPRGRGAAACSPTRWRAARRGTSP